MGDIEKRVIGVLFLMILCLRIADASLGMSPAVLHYNFEPNSKTEVSFTVLESDPEQLLELYVLGDLAKYATLNKTEMTGSGSFIVTLNLPEKIDKPGTHQIIVGARENPGEVAGIGTAIAVQASLYISVPYPGKYAELTLKSNNINVGESEVFELGISNRGDEDLNITPYIDISSDNKTVETLYFNNRFMKSQDAVTLTKMLDTSSYKAGRYKATAIVNYGETATAESEFRIGSLFVDVVNCTDKILIQGLSKFQVGVESGWNNKIEDIYAGVSFYNDSEVVAGIKTPPVSLLPWEIGTLESFVDTSNFAPGIYKANITLFYSGSSSGKIMDVEFIEIKKKLLTIWMIIAGAFILLVVSAYLILRKNAKKKNKKQEKKKPL